MRCGESTSTVSAVVSSCRHRVEAIAAFMPSAFNNLYVRRNEKIFLNEKDEGFFCCTERGSREWKIMTVSV